jgi:repressor LexA
MSPMLTPKQKKVLDFIESHLKKKGYAPSQQEIARHFKFKSLGTVQNYLVRLERNGFIQKTWNARRSLEPVKAPLESDGTASHAGLRKGELNSPSPQRSANLSQIHEVKSGSVPLPLLGRVAAGKPIEAIETGEPVDVPASLLSPGAKHFVLKVSGNSMIEDGILDGDFVVIREQDTASNGQTVVALVGNEATIKRFYQRRDRIELHPANAAYEPLVLSNLNDSALDFQIEGILVGLIRRVPS